MNGHIPDFFRIARPMGSAARVAMLTLVPIATAVAADERRSPLPELSAPFGSVGWGLVVALGLVAVAAGALTMRRQRPPGPPERAANDSTLGATVGGTTVGTHAAAPDEGHGGAPAARTAPTPVPSSVNLRSQAEVGPGVSRLAVAPASSVSTTDRAASAPPVEQADSDVAAGRHAFLAIHHVDLSIDVLRRHVDGEARPMPAVWVMLLDLCRTHGRERKFCELALEFHQRFNVRAPHWERYPPGRSEPGLEAYPRLVKAITATWGTYECRRLLERLLYDNRGGARRGFTVNAYNDLIALRRAADSVLETIEADLALEAGSAVAPRGEASANDEVASRPPLIGELEDQLDGDLAPANVARSALEREHPAFTAVLAREWGNAALVGRLCEMLARGGEGAQPLSAEVEEELELLRRMAERLGTPPRAAAASGG